MTPKQAAILYWRNDNPPQELIAAMAEAQRPLLEALQALAPELRIMAEWATSPPLKEEYTAKHQRALAAIARALGNA